MTQTQEPDVLTPQDQNPVPVRTRRRRWIRLAGLVALASLLIVMLITKPGTGRPTPELSGAGQAGLLLGVWIIAVAIVHMVHLGRATGAR